MQTCCVCGASDFRVGPGDRLSPTGVKPQCVQCGSLERHRIHRLMYETLGTRHLGSYRCLHFALDASIDRTWFREYEISEFTGRNSIDLQSINRQDKSYDVVHCSHVLEHVADYRAALRELGR